MESSGPGFQSMDRLVELLNSMRSNSSGVEQQLTSFMEEAQSSARSEESLAQVVTAIYSKAVSDRSFAATAAKLCEKMAMFMVEGTKFRSITAAQSAAGESTEKTICHVSRNKIHGYSHDIGRINIHISN